MRIRVKVFCCVSSCPLVGTGIVAVLALAAAMSCTDRDVDPHHYEVDPDDPESVRKACETSCEVRVHCDDPSASTDLCVERCVDGRNFFELDEYCWRLVIDQIACFSTLTCEELDMRLTPMEQDQMPGVDFPCKQPSDPEVVPDTASECIANPPCRVPWGTPKPAYCLDE